MGFFIFMRTAVFIDYQNVYMRARHAFGAPGAEHWHGQINPRLVGEQIIGKAARSRSRAGSTWESSSPQTRT